MSDYRIVCTNQEPCYLSTHQAHIVAVGTGDDPSQASQRWSLDEVLGAMRRGDRFYTQGVRSGKVALVEPYTCQHCRRTYIRSRADAVQDNNLDNLRVCNWKQAGSRTS